MSAISGLWTNAGTIGGTSIDIRATVVTLSASTVSFFTQGDDPSIILNGGATTSIKWEIFASGTSQTVIAVGSPNFQIADIDGVAGAPNSREVVRPQLNGLTAYTTDSPTNLVTAVSASGVQISGTQNQNGESTSLAAFRWQDVSSWIVDYTLNPASGFVNAVFRHDGDGDFTFVSAQTTAMLSVDLDANNSTATGTAYQATYVENAAAIPVVDSDVSITQNAALGTTLGQARVVLTNAQAGDVLSVGALPAGIVATIDTSVGGQITVTLSGSGTVADYQAALAAIRFENTSQTPSAVDRQISVDVTNTLFGTTSAVALSTIHVTAVNDAPVAVADGPVPVVPSVSTNIAVLGNDSDPDGDTLAVSQINGTNVAIGGAVTLASGTVVTRNADGTLGVVMGPGSAVDEAFNYTISDGNGGTSTATVTVERDTDGDGVKNSVDIDDDNDGLIDTNEGIGLGYQYATYSSVTSTQATGTVAGIDFTYTSSKPITTTTSCSPTMFSPPNSTWRTSIRQFRTPKPASTR